ncbi:MAG: stage V sporulation protein AD [Clostridia bacterium]|nr:stage V sporulation protein AD [Clostridia bacterium]
MPERIGKRTLNLPNRPVITASAGVAGKKESEGPLGEQFDYIFDDTTAGEKTWEKAESTIHKEAIIRAKEKSGKDFEEFQYIFAGDLLNQCTGSTFGLRDFGVAFAGIYGACSTMALGLCMAGVFVDSGAAQACIASTSSHFCSAEKQFRFPVEYGNQRTPAAQWTVTGAGAAVVEAQGEGVHIEKVCFGKIVDLGVTDANNMGAAMAPAAFDTISSFLEDTQTDVDDLDMIVTGDLGVVGSRLLCEMFLNEKGIDITKKHCDCGILIYNLEEQDVNSGGSGCGCSASVLCSHILNRMNSGELKRVLFTATGALMSPVSSMQGESIPSIAHSVLLVK